MRCKKHLNDLSSAVGVCASCLRGRLFTLIQQQSETPNQLQSNSSIQNPNPNPNCNRLQQQQQQKQQQPPQLIFPRSVSPYITRRKSEPIQRFFTTPQVNINPNPNPKKKSNSSGKFGLISRLFRSKSSATTSSSNSTVISHNSVDFACRNKGMSPENESEESSPARWAARPSPARVTRPSPGRAASMAFCLSPLVRASPARNWRSGEKSGFSGEIRVSSCNGNNESSKISSNNNNTKKPNLSNAASFCANRSRKLADFGRINNVNR